ncbi:HIT-like domain-containing protein, partial [Phlyctochytrium arcticum]
LTVKLQDDQFVAFNDRSPGASLHLLIIPKSHIGTVRNLSPSSHTLLSDLHVLATRLLIENGYTAPDQRRIGFHVPPFNSVNHLHCHVLGLPFKNWIRKVKYEPAGWAIWFVDLELLIRALRA